MLPTSLTPTQLPDPIANNKHKNNKQQKKAPHRRTQKRKRKFEERASCGD